MTARIETCNKVERQLCVTLLFIGCFIENYFCRTKLICLLHLSWPHHMGETNRDGFLWENFLISIFFVTWEIDKKRLNGMLTKKEKSCKT
jgi:hypothetical protein